MLCSKPSCRIPSSCATETSLRFKPECAPRGEKGIELDLRNDVTANAECNTMREHAAQP